MRSLSSASGDGTACRCLRAQALSGRAGGGTERARSDRPDASTSQTPGRERGSQR